MRPARTTTAHTATSHARRSAVQNDSAYTPTARPLCHVARIRAMTRTSVPSDSAASASTVAGAYAPATVDALAALSLGTLVRVMARIRATWHNGRAVGVYAESFWTALRRAWDVAVCAVVVRAGRMPRAAHEIHSA